MKRKKKKKKKGNRLGCRSSLRLVTLALLRVRRCDGRVGVWPCSSHTLSQVVGRWPAALWCRGGVEVVSRVSTNDEAQVDCGDLLAAFDWPVNFVQTAQGSESVKLQMFCAGPQARPRAAGEEGNGARRRCLVQYSTYRAILCFTGMHCIPSRECESSVCC